MAGARSRDGWRYSYQKRPPDPVQDGQAAARAADEPTGERGLRAAHAVTTGTYSPGTAAHTFCVDRDCLRYYRKKLLDSGFDELHASVSAGTTSASAPVEEPAIASKVNEWELYCDAYVHAGTLI